MQGLALQRQVEFRVTKIGGKQGEAGLAWKGWFVPRERLDCWYPMLTPTLFFPRRMSHVGKDEGLVGCPRTQELRSLFELSPGVRVSDNKHPDIFVDGPRWSGLEECVCGGQLRF